MAVKKEQEIQEQEKQEPVTMQDPWEIMREVYIPHQRGEERTLPVSINSRDFAVPKGMRVQVPQPVYEVVMNMLDQMEKTDEQAEKDLAFHDRGVVG